MIRYCGRGLRGCNPYLAEGQRWGFGSTLPLLPQRDNRDESKAIEELKKTIQLELCSHVSMAVGEKNWRAIRRHMFAAAQDNPNIR